MKQFLEYIPLIFFLIVAKMDERVITLGGTDFTVGGIYSATAVLMTLTVLCYGAQYLIDGKLTKIQWIVVIAVLVFGSSTLLMRSEAILKWKAPVVNWIIAGIFLASQFFRKEPMAKTMFGHIVTMPEQRWTRLNMAWVLTFFVVGTSNLIVAFMLQEYVNWISFKVFGSMAILLVATAAQMFYIYPYLNPDEAETPKPEE